MMTIDDVMAIFQPPKGFAKKRMDICGTCDEYRAAQKRCRKCGCIVPLKVKIPNTGCPIRKWGPETTEDA
jgi:hypothetical protein